MTPDAEPACEIDAAATLLSFGSSFSDFSKVAKKTVLVDPPTTSISEGAQTQSPQPQSHPQPQPQPQQLQPQPTQPPSQPPLEQQQQIRPVAQSKFRIVAKFPAKLMEMISDEANSQCIRWQPHGRSFVILCPDRFTSEVLPRYFKETKFSSFTRKLYRWGFRYISKGPDAGSYIHRLFRRDNPSVCLEIGCGEEVRDGCPELHGGINAESLLLLKMSDRRKAMLRLAEHSRRGKRSGSGVAAAIADMKAYQSTGADLGKVSQPPRLCEAPASTLAQACSNEGQDAPSRLNKIDEFSMALMRRHQTQIERRKALLDRVQMDTSENVRQDLVIPARTENAARGGVHHRSTTKAVVNKAKKVKATIGIDLDRCRLVMETAQGFKSTTFNPTAKGMALIEKSLRLKTHHPYHHVSTSTMVNPSPEENFPQLLLPKKRMLQEVEEQRSSERLRRIRALQVAYRTATMSPPPPNQPLAVAQQENLIATGIIQRAVNSLSHLSYY